MFTVRLLVPPPYVRDAHDQAEDTGDYSALRVERPVTVTTEGDWTVVDVPPVTPWGLLVLEGERSGVRPSTDAPDTQRHP